jgi:hypothetical protein
LFIVNRALGITVSQRESDVGHGLTWQFTFAELSKLNMLRTTAIRAATRVME